VKPANLWSDVALLSLAAAMWAGYIASTIHWVLCLAGKADAAKLPRVVRGIRNFFLYVLALCIVCGVYYLVLGDTKFNAWADYLRGAAPKAGLMAALFILYVLYGLERERIENAQAKAENEPTKG